MGTWTQRMSSSHPTTWTMIRPCPRMFMALKGSRNMSARTARRFLLSTLRSEARAAGGVRGPEGCKEYVAAYRSAFSDLHLEIEDQIAEGDKVVTRWTGTGTHDGELAGIPPTGNQVTLPEMEIVRISGGKLVEGWEGYDSMNLMRQLGVV